MERLTYRSPRFNNPVSNGACEKIKCSAKCDSCKINDLIAKLCAYEDTGLEPEEIIGLKNTCEQLSGINDSLFKANQEMGKDLAEWKKANDNGRMVVLPCKVGDSIYIPDLEKKIPVKVRVQGISISVSGRTILHFGGYPVECAWGDGCGKDWFLAREEAEAALKGGESDA